MKKLHFGRRWWESAEHGLFAAQSVLMHYLPVGAILIFSMVALHVSIHSADEQKAILSFNQSQSQNQSALEQKLAALHETLARYFMTGDQNFYTQAQKEFEYFIVFFEDRLGKPLPKELESGAIPKQEYETAQSVVRSEITKLALKLAARHDGIILEAREQFEMLGMIKPLHEAVGRLSSIAYNEDTMRENIRDIEGHARYIYWSVIAVGLSGFLLVLLNTDKMMRLRRSAKEREKYIAELLRAEHEHKILQDQFYQAQKMEAVGRMAGGIAHDFNNILAAMNGFAEFLVEDLQDKRELQKYALNILQAGRQARDLIDQLMTFSRRNNQTERHPMDLRALIDDNASIMKASMPRSIELVVQSQLRQAPLIGDQGQIAQALMNLCVNARDAIESDRGTIEITLENVTLSDYESVLPVQDSLPTTQDQPSIRIDDVAPGQTVLGLGVLSRQHGYVALSVRDNGMGISRTTMEQMFEPFFTTKPVNKGTGLGLSTVMGMVAAHQGALVVRSSLRKGTSFTILFPVLDSEKEDKSLATTLESKDLPNVISGRVLLVEDEPSVQAMMADMLGRMGVEVQVCDSGLEALDILREHPGTFDAVVTDHNMPKMTGIELAFQAGIDFPNLPFVMVTGYAEMELRDLVAEQVNIKALLRKPVARESLTHALLQALHGTNRKAA